MKATLIENYTVIENHSGTIICYCDTKDQAETVINAFGWRDSECGSLPKEGYSIVTEERELKP